jgi:hypothetical protein
MLIYSDSLWNSGIGFRIKLNRPTDLHTCYHALSLSLSLLETVLVPDSFNYRQEERLTIGRHPKSMHSYTFFFRLDFQLLVSIWRPCEYFGSCNNGFVQLMAITVCIAITRLFENNFCLVWKRTKMKPEISLYIFHLVPLTGDPLLLCSWNLRQQKVRDMSVSKCCVRNVLPTIKRARSSLHSALRLLTRHVRESYLHVYVYHLLTEAMRLAPLFWMSRYLHFRYVLDSRRPCTKSNS